MSLIKRVIVSGRSGSGKTVALRALEDQGFYCVDNIPIRLIPQLLEQTERHYTGLAIGIDARNLAHGKEDFENLLKDLQTSSHAFEIIYIDANDSTLLKRFSETRRRHPLAMQGLSLSEALEKEKSRLEPFVHFATHLIDTTAKSPHELCRIVVEKLLGDSSNHISLLFQSFGFKNGAPENADFVFDVRCLPNPYWIEALRPLNGKDQAIIDYLDAQSVAQEYCWQLEIFLQTWLPRFERGNRNYLTVAIGCTGGQHRSVYVAEKLAKSFIDQFPSIQVRHRELISPVKPDPADSNI